VANALAAAVTCASLGVPSPVIAAALNAAPPVPGRFEPVVTEPFSVVVDYAHKPDALAAALRAARRSARTARVIVVVGAGGDRDPGKRPMMGAVAAELADAVIFTSDNPRSEDPLEIIDALIAGVPPEVRGGLIVEPDRRAAIAAAVHLARPGDVVVLAGKGNEATQTVGDEVFPFDDRRVAREVLDGLP
jgi:UDP-N-acetylmuramoyl-L-alanyl-D-glutamate--2,6-diaminopimelate ligase